MTNAKWMAFANWKVAIFYVVNGAALELQFARKSYVYVITLLFWAPESTEISRGVCSRVNIDNFFFFFWIVALEYWCLGVFLLSGVFGKLIQAGSVRRKLAEKKRLVIRYTIIHLCQIISSCAQKNDMNSSTRVIVPGTHRSAMCMLLRSEHLLQLIVNLSFVIVCFIVICQNCTPSKILSSNIISCNFIYNANGIFKSWEFYHSRPSAGNKKSVHIISFLDGRTWRTCAGHTMICYKAFSPTSFNFFSSTIEEFIYKTW